MRVNCITPYYAHVPHRERVAIIENGLNPWSYNGLRDMGIIKTSRCIRRITMDDYKKAVEGTKAYISKQNRAIRKLETEKKQLMRAVLGLIVILIMVVGTLIAGEYIQRTDINYRLDTLEAQR